MCEVLLEGQCRILWEEKAGITNLGLGMPRKKLGERTVAEESSAQLKSYRVLSTYSHFFTQQRYIRSIIYHMAFFS